MRTLIAGNWKMNPPGLAGAEALARALRLSAARAVDLLVCPPFTALASVAALLRGTGIALGAQDCAATGEAGGAHTGEISAAMLRDLGVSHVILGHSERRAHQAESDATVRAKAVAAAAAGLIPLVCVGETEAERRAGRAQAVVAGQLAGSLPDGFSGIIAYEPVWAIGTGLTPSAGEIAAMHAAIAADLATRFPARAAALPVLYGGSVKPGNAAEVLALAHVGGALVGGASLVAEDFLAIAAAAR